MNLDTAMRKVKTILTVSFLFVLLSLVYLTTGCTKEYSYEQKPLDTTSVNPVPIPVSLPTQASCVLCNYATVPDSSWRFSIDGVTYCGKTDGAIALQQRTSFTFFGPSSCSIDSGFVATVRLENESDALTSDKQNIRARLTCYYYDKVGPTYPFMSPMGDYLILNIVNYNQQTGIAVGTFGGIVEDASGLRKEVKDGTFRIKL